LAEGVDLSISKPIAASESAAAGQFVALPRRHHCAPIFAAASRFEKNLIDRCNSVSRSLNTGFMAWKTASDLGGRAAAAVAFAFQAVPALANVSFKLLRQRFGEVAPAIESAAGQTL